MKNILNYYYSLYPRKVFFKNEKYFFEYLDANYVFEPYTRPISDLDELYSINKQMINKNILVHEIILNNDNKILTYVNNTSYVLMEIKVNINKKIELQEICYINNNAINIKTNKILDRTNWIELWEAKNDYFESQIVEIERRFPAICSYANYYIGLAENAITYVYNALLIKDTVQYSVCHKRINILDTVYDLYHPFNYVYDYRVRDIAEFVKTCFFNNINTKELLECYFINNYISYKEALLLYARLLYPSYFFDLYDDVVNNKMGEESVDKIIKKSQDYELFLEEVYILLSNMYKRYIPAVDWIIKRSLY